MGGKTDDIEHPANPSIFHNHPPSINASMTRSPFVLFKYPIVLNKALSTRLTYPAPFQPHRLGGPAAKKILTEGLEIVPLITLPISNLAPLWRMEQGQSQIPSYEEIQP